MWKLIREQSTNEGPYDSACVCKIVGGNKRCSTNVEYSKGNYLDTNPPWINTRGVQRNSELLNIFQVIAWEARIFQAVWITNRISSTVTNENLYFWHKRRSQERLLCLLWWRFAGTYASHLISSPWSWFFAPYLPFQNPDRKFCSLVKIVPIF